MSDPHLHGIILLVALKISRETDDTAVQINRIIRPAIREFFTQVIEDDGTVLRKMSGGGSVKKMNRFKKT
ncbi:MAG: hypothetical protein ACWGOD_10185 [Desulfobulbales bacterium]